MSYILYYSKHCRNCQDLLVKLKSHPPESEVHYLPVDNRVVKNGVTYLCLSNGEEVTLPPTIQSVPALLQLERGCTVLFGDEIAPLLIPQRGNTYEEVQTATIPDSFSFAGASGGVASDVFSYLDQSAEELEAKGSGGMRQRHHYAGLDHNEQIRTPPDTWTPSKVTSASMEKYKSERDSLNTKNT